MSARALAECDLLQELSWHVDYHQPDIEASPADDGARRSALGRWASEHAGFASEVLCAVSVTVQSSLRLEDIIDCVWAEFKGDAAPEPGEPRELCLAIISAGGA